MFSKIFVIADYFYVLVYCLERNWSIIVKESGCKDRGIFDGCWTGTQLRNEWAEGAGSTPDTEVFCVCVSAGNH